MPESFGELHGVELFRTGKWAGIEWDESSLDAMASNFVALKETIRPRLTLSGQVDVIALEYPTVQLKVKIDESGKVISVDVIRSSGSNEIDLSCQRAMYAWWIEPAKAADGKAMVTAGVPV